MNEVYVFRTSISTEKQIQQATILLSSFNSITKIDFDPEDCDNVLRIESNKEVTQAVISLFSANGLFCEELN